MSRPGTVRTAADAAVPADQPLFQAYPPHITFQGYEPGKVYEQRLTFRNNDKVRLSLMTQETVF